MIFKFNLIWSRAICVFFYCCCNDAMIPNVSITKGKVFFRFCYWTYILMGIYFTSSTSSAHPSIATIELILDLSNWSLRIHSEFITYSLSFSLYVRKTVELVTELYQMHSHINFVTNFILGTFPLLFLTFIFLFRMFSCAFAHVFHLFFSHPLFRMAWQMAWEHHMASNAKNDCCECIAFSVRSHFSMKMRQVIETKTKNMNDQRKDCFFS